MVGFTEAEVRNLGGDLLESWARQFPGVRFIGLIVVFHGRELVYCDSVRR